MELGYWLSSEEHPPADLIANARAAEQGGFSYAVISDHFHPWVDAQGQSPFVWTVLGGIAEATDRLTVGTGVTCPLIRIHPAIVAHAAATAAALFEGRFFLGVGTGENLNEHVTGAKWPTPDERLEMLDEAIELMRKLWQGGYQTYRGKHYTVEQARLYTLPDEPPPIVVAASQEQAAQVAGRLGDGYMNIAPDAEVLEIYESAGGSGPKYGKVTGCLAGSPEEATRVAHERWPNAALGGSLSQDLALPRDFEAASKTVRPEDVAESLVVGNDADEWVEKIREFERAGFTHVALHDLNRDQQPFIAFARNEIATRL